VGRGGRSHIWLAVLAGAVVLAGVGGAAIGLGLPGWLAGTTAAVTALIAAAITERVFDAKAERAAALETRRRVLDSLMPSRTGPAHLAATAANALALLRADRSPMPFRARTREMGQLAEWRSGEETPPVLLLGGPAGVGKTRLALEFGQQVPAGWVAGWLHAGTGVDAIGAVAACDEPAVILVDDADGRTDLVPLLDALAGHCGEPVIRVLLVTRSADGLRASLAARLEERHAEIVSGAAALELGQAGGPEDEERWFGEAVCAFAAILGKPVPVLSEHFPNPGTVKTEPFVMTQARALLAVLGCGEGDPDPRRLSFGEVAGELMRHEKRRWDSTARAWDWGIGGPPADVVREHAITTLALLSNVEAAETLRRVPELRDSSAERRHAIVSWIASLYPSGPDPSPRIRPDVIGDWFVVSHLADNPSLTQGLRAELTDDQAAHALCLLARAADRLADAGPLFGQFAAGDVRRQVLAAGQAALTGDASRNLLDSVIAEQLASAPGWTLDQLTDLMNLIPEYVLLRTRITIADLIVAMDRALAADNPDEHNHGLAHALDYLGVQLGRVGRYHEALGTSTEAVALHRSLATTNPDVYPCFASALDNLMVHLGRLGREQEALAPITEAVDLYRALATTNPDAYQPYLAGTLEHVGSQLNNLGRYEEALTPTAEAIDLYRALASTNPDAYNPGLANALNSYGIMLNELGRHEEALTLTAEAVDLYRALAATNPNAYNPGLADALESLGTRLFDLGRHQEALTPTAEAVALFRALAADNPSAHNPGLADALKSLGNRLSDLDRHQEALTPTAEAVALFRALAADNPSAHNPGLARALNNYGIELYLLGRHQEALTLTVEGIALCRALAADNPNAHNPGLARALNNYGVMLEGLGQRQNALDARAEAVRLYRDLADRDPDLYQIEYHRRDGALRQEYALLGMERQATAPDLGQPNSPAVPSATEES
jgi:hypothetical protein